jgi:hypothetical protein
MTPRHLIILAALGVVLATGCSKRVMVERPPRVDLMSFHMIGIVQFKSDAEGKLPEFTTRRFVETIQGAQPGVRLLELGSIEEVLEAIGHDELDFNAIKAMKETYGVDAVFLGELVVDDVRPNVDLHSMFSTMSVSADVDASLGVRMFETAIGSTIWSRSTRRTSSVAHVGLGGGTVDFDAQDPERAYGTLADALINDVTSDFRVTWVKQ